MKTFQLSIQKKLLLALIILLLLAISSSLVAWLALNQTDKQQQSLLTQSLPTLYFIDNAVNTGVELLDVADQLSRPINALLLNPLAIKTTNLISQVRADLTRLEQQQLSNNEISLLKKESDAVISLINQQMNIQRQIIKLQSTIDNETIAIKAKSNAVLIDIKIISSTLSLQLLNNEQPSNREKIQYQLSNLMELRFDVQRMMSIIDDARINDSLENIIKDKSLYRNQLKKLGLKIIYFDAQHQQDLIGNIGILNDLFLKKDNFYNNLETQSALSASLSTLKNKNAILNQQLRQHYKSISDIAKQKLDVEANNILAISSIAKRVLVVSVIIFIVIVFMLFIFFIKPKITNRLSRLASATRDIADGEYYLSINTEGTDEISAMASSLAYFRDQLIEKDQVKNILSDNQIALSTIVDNAAEGLFTVDKQGFITTLNPAFITMFGINTGTEEDHYINEFLPDLVHAFAENHDDGSHENRVILQSESTIATHTNGHTFFANVSISLLFLSGKSVYSGFIRDVTKEHIAQQKMNDMVKQLSSSNTDLERFAYSCSHDLQEPVRIIASFTELLSDRLKDNEDETVHRYLNFLSRSSKEAREMIKSILEYSKLDQSSVDKIWVNSNTLEKRLKNTLSLLLQQNGADLLWENHTEIYAVENQLFQVLLNLVVNGIKYNDNAKPQVIIDALEHPTYWEVTVTDNGIGIDPRYHQQIFDLFKRLVNKRDYSGSGIGLATCKKIVEKHGGIITIVSEEGKGSCFHIKLPKTDNNDVLYNLEHV